MQKQAKPTKPRRVRLYTDYPFVELGDAPGQHAPIREIQRVVDYDGNKYCAVIIDGVRLSVKAGYLYPDKPKPGVLPKSAGIAAILNFVSRGE